MVWLRVVLERKMFVFFVERCGCFGVLVDVGYVE